MSINDPTPRRYDRAQDLILVNYRLVDFEKGLGDFDEGMTASTIDVGAGGMQLRMTENFAVRTLLDLRFRVRPEGREITVLSMIMGSAEGEYKGIFHVSAEYLLLAEEDKAEIDRYVQEFNRRRD